MRHRKILSKMNELEVTIRLLQERVSDLTNQNEKQSSYILNLMKQKFEKDYRATHEAPYWMSDGEKHYVPLPIPYYEFYYDDGVVIVGQTH